MSCFGFLFSVFFHFDLLHLLFLASDHLLQTRVLEVLLLLLHLHQFLLLSLFLLESLSLLQQLALVLLLRHLNGFPYLHLHGLISLCQHPLFELLLLDPLLLDLLLFNVALLNTHDLLGFLLCVFDFLPSLAHISTRVVPSFPPFSGAGFGFEAASRLLRLASSLVENPPSRSWLTLLERPFLLHTCTAIDLIDCQD